MIIYFIVESSASNFLSNSWDARGEGPMGKEEQERERESAIQ
jgi:hypothetical protein